VLGEGTYPVSQEAHIRFGTPMDVAGVLAQRELTVKTGVGPITQLLSDRIQSMLEDLPGKQNVPAA